MGHYFCHFKCMKSYFNKLDYRLSPVAIIYPGGSFRHFLGEVTRELHGDRLRLLMPCPSSAVDKNRGRYILRPDPMTYPEEKLLIFFGQVGGLDNSDIVEPRYNEDLGTMKITLLYQVSHYLRVKKQRNIKSWDQQNHLVVRGFSYIRPLYNEVPLYRPEFKKLVYFQSTD